MSMIDERTILEAIKECESEPLTMAKISKLADFYTVYNHNFGSEQNMSSFSDNSENKTEKTVKMTGGSEFSKLINGKNADKVLEIVDELMEVLKNLQPRLYDGVLRRISEI